MVRECFFGVCVMKDIRRKVDLYILSLALLFLFIMIITFNLTSLPFCLAGDVGWWRLLLDNYLPLISFVFLLYSFYAYKRFDFDLEGATDIPFTVTKIEGINYEHLTFLATYVVPLISFDFQNGQQMVVLVLLLMSMGAIYIKTDLFYANPSLALLGFHIYRADGHFKNGDRQGIVLISRARVVEGQKAAYIKLDERIYYVRSAV